MMDHAEAVRRILAEMDEMRDWVSVAGALGALDINPFRAAGHQVRFVLETVLSSDRLFFGRVEGLSFVPLPGGTTVDQLLDELYHSPSPHPNPLQVMKPGAPDALTIDRVGAMMELLIDNRAGIAGR